MTGEVIRASKTTAVRYERDRPGELIHVDVKKIGRIPDGGGWRVDRATCMGSIARRRRNGHVSAMTMSTPLSMTTAVSPIPRSTLMRQGATAAGFIERAAVFFAAHGIKHRSSGS